VQKEPLHLLGLRAAVYAAAVFLFLGQLTAWRVTLTAVGAALAALVLGRRLAASRLRTPVLLAAAAGCVLLGVGLQAALGNSPQVAAALGVRATLAVTEGAAFGLGTFGVVLALRTLAARWPVLALLEVAFVAVSVVQLFAGHRDYQLGEPRFFSDWAFSNGYDPLTLLRGVGVAALAGLGLLLLPKRRLGWTLAALAALAVLLAVGGWLAMAAWDRPDDDPGAAPQGSHDPLNFHDKPPDPHDPTPVALVTFHDDFEPVDDAYHLRERTYSVLRGTRLAPGPQDDAYPDVPRSFPREPTAVGGEHPPDWMSREIDVTVALLERKEAPLCFVTPVLLSPRDNPDPTSFRVVYDCKARVLLPRVHEPPAIRPTNWVERWLGHADTPEVHSYQALARLPAGDPAWSDEERKQYLEYPDDPRYLEFSNRLIDEASADGELTADLKDSPFARALVLMKWIRENTVYTRQPGNGDQADPTADFLFGRREGFCVHVAHAMAFMLRAQGVPTRIAGGYAQDADERPAGSSILFTAGDAHAWCEIYLQGVGWVAIDGSPERTKDPPVRRPDSVLQQHLVDKVNGEAPPPTGKALLDEVLDFLRRWLPGGAAAATAALLAALYGVKVWRRLAPRLAPAGQLYRVCFRAVLDRLAEVGVRRRFGETREEFAQRLAVLGPEFEELTAGHVRRAVTGSDALERSRWNALRARVEERIARTFPLLRRLLGAVNPVSWVGAR
jgi:transglutaminase-like putative cysteine protease